MWYLNWAWPLVVVGVVIGQPIQSREAAQSVNLGRLESTRVSVSSVNGKREQDNPYYGAQNLVDGGRHLIDGINYTTWLSDQDASHWIRMEFRNPVDIKSIMFELTALDSRPPNVISAVDPGDDQIVESPSAGGSGTRRRLRGSRWANAHGQAAVDIVERLQVLLSSREAARGRRRTDARVSWPVDGRSSGNRSNGHDPLILGSQRPCDGHQGCRWESGIPSRRTVSLSKSNSISTTGSLPTTQPS